jgi:membrane protease YdiL (CAAX protease family)
MTEHERIWTAGAASDPAAPDPRFRWGPWATVGWVAVIGLVTLLAVSAVAILLAWYQMSSGAVQAGPRTALLRTVEDHLAALTAAQALIVAALVVALTRRKGALGRARMLALEPIGLRRLAVTMAAMVIALYLLTEVPQTILGISDQEALKWITKLRPVWLAAPLLVVVGPISEELLFRGFAYGGLAPSRIGPIGAILVTSTIWAVVHFQYAWPIIGQIFVYGLVLGVARWRTGSLWPPLVVHVLINLYAVIAAYHTYGAPA